MKFSPANLRGDQRLLFIGQTGSGKSVLSRYLLKVARKQGWRIVIVDPKKDWMHYLGKKYKFAEKGHGTVDSPWLVEEFYPKYAVQIFQPVVIWTQGRALNIGGWCATQRPKGIPIVVKDQSEVWFLFRINSKDDRLVVRGHLPLDETPEVVDKPLPKYWFYYWEDSMPRPMLVKPLNLEKVAA